MISFFMSETQYPHALIVHNRIAMLSCQQQHTATPRISHPPLASESHKPDPDQKKPHFLFAALRF